jgi:hypothetical protein
MTCIARNKLTGTTFYSPSETHPGLTLFAPLDGKEILLVNMVGKTIHKWQTPYKPASYAELLANGNLLYAGRVEDGPLAYLDGAGGKLMEVDKDCKIVWEYDEPYQHHCFKRLENGNTLILKWVKVPSKTASKVRGGVTDTKKGALMWGDCLEEVTADGKIVWKWLAHEHLDAEADSICPACSRREWTHITSIDTLANGDILLNCMRTNTVIVVDKKSGEVKFRWGKQELSHPNCATVTKKGNFLILDCGRHTPGEGQGFSRAIELNPDDQKVLWGYEEDPPHYLFSCFLGSCQRLPNGNTLIVEGTTGRMLEVNQKNCMSWEYVNPYVYDSKDYPNNRYIFRAFRYGLDYIGLRKFYGLEKDWIMWDDLESSKAAEKEMQKAKEPEPSMEDVIRSRLEPLGY